MARLQFAFGLLTATLLLLGSVGSAAPCAECFTQSRAAYYPNSDDKGTESEFISESFQHYALKWYLQICANDFIDITILNLDCI